MKNRPSDKMSAPNNANQPALKTMVVRLFLRSKLARKGKNPTKNTQKSIAFSKSSPLNNEATAPLPSASTLSQKAAEMRRIKAFALERFRQSLRK